MKNHSQKNLLGDIEKKNISQTYHAWRKRRQKNTAAEPLFFRPINVESHEIAQEMRIIQNSALKFLPLFMTWYVAEFICTLGALLRQPSLEGRGKKILNVLQNFKAIR